MRTERAIGYREDAPPATVFALAEPDSEPLPVPTRTTVLWQHTDWAEIDVETGRIVCTGSVAEDGDV